MLCDNVCVSLSFGGLSDVIFVLIILSKFKDLFFKEKKKVLFFKLLKCVCLMNGGFD